MKNGDSRRGPFSWTVSAPSVMPGRPPIPEPIITPVRSRSTASVGFQPESSTACAAAASAKTMNSSILRCSLGGTHSSALNEPDVVSPRGTWPAIFAGRSDTSKFWIARIPDWPSSRRFQTVPVPTPKGVTTPQPVTTTRLMDETLRFVLLDKANRVLYGHDFLGRIVGNFAAEFFLERHDQFDSVEAVGAQIVDEAGILGHFRVVNAQMLDDDLLNPVGDIAHETYLRKIDALLATNVDGSRC